MSNSLSIPPGFFQPRVWIFQSRASKQWQYSISFFQTFWVGYVSNSCLSGHQRRFYLNTFKYPKLVHGYARLNEIITQTRPSNWNIGFLKSIINDSAHFIPEYMVSSWQVASTSAMIRNNFVYIRGGADKYLARPRRKQATATKLGIYST